MARPDRTMTRVAEPTALMVICPRLCEPVPAMAVALFMIEVARESPAAESSPMALTAQPCTTTSRSRPARASRAGSARWYHMSRRPR